MRTIKEEQVDLSDYDSSEDAREQIGEFIGMVYDRKRIHSAIGYQTPEEFKAACYQVQAVLLSRLWNLSS